MIYLVLFILTATFYAISYFFFLFSKKEEDDESKILKVLLEFATIFSTLFMISNIFMVYHYFKMALYFIRAFEEPGTKSIRQKYYILFLTTFVLIYNFVVEPIA